MKLLHVQYGFSMELKENHINLLVVEDAKALSEIVEDFIRQSEGGEGNLVLSEGDDPISIAKVVDFCLEPFSLDCNNKKILSKLYQYIENELNDELIGKVRQQLVVCLEEVCKISDVTVSYDEMISFSDVLKIGKLQVETMAVSLVEKVLEYMILSHRFLKYRVFVFVNLKSFLRKEELELLYQECFYRKIQLILIEGYHCGEKLETESLCLIDKDKCVIYS